MESQSCFNTFLAILTLITAGRAEENIPPANSANNPQECFDAYALSNEPEKRITFKLDLPFCEINLMGSKTERCIVQLLCSPLEFKSTDVNENFLEVTDGLLGFLGTTASDAVSVPLRASNQGRDLYIRYKGPIGGSCNASCVLDKSNRSQRIWDRVIYRVMDYWNGRSETDFTTLKQGLANRMEEDCECGISEQGQQGRIVGGNDASPFQYPWLVALVFKNTREGFCGASLINDEYVLTAAHCLVDDNDPDEDLNVNSFEVLLHAHILDLSLDNSYNENAKAGETGTIHDVKGKDHKNVTDTEESSIRIIPKDYYVHPLYNNVRKSKKRYDYDLAIIQLSEKVDLKKVSPICLPAEGKIFVPLEKDATVAGWGKPHENEAAGNRILQKLDIPLLSNKKCSNLLNKEVTPRMICGGYLEGGKDSCTGDSGGPLIHKHETIENKFRQVGIVSYGIGCAGPQLPGIYTNIQEVIQWIYKNAINAKWCRKSP